MLTAGIRKIQQIITDASIIAHRFLLEEAQGENHIADFTGCRQQANGNGLRIILLPVTLIGFAGIAQELIVNNGNHHFLKADATVHKVQSAATHFNADVLTGSEGSQPGCLVGEFHRQQIVRLCALLHQSVPATVLHILLTEAGLVHLVILSQRAVSIQEAVVGSNENPGATEVIDNHADQVLNFVNCIVACREYQVVRSMAGFVNLIVIDVDDIHTLDQRLTVGTLHSNDILVLKCNAGAVGGL